MESNIEIISAPSVLGLKPTGVERLAESLLASGLAGNLHAVRPVIHVPTLNVLYSNKRDSETNCLNAKPLRAFSRTLGKVVSTSVRDRKFPFVLGGDCSILIGIMSALKAEGTYGLAFLDAHADFYEPEKSVTGEVADMDLAIITGRGPELLTNIENMKPYVQDRHVVHIGQRDAAETKRYGSRDIRETAITCIDLAAIEEKSIDSIAAEGIENLSGPGLQGCWIHFDTDVLSDAINPAVDYRLPGGLTFYQAEQLIKYLLRTGKVTGMSVSIFNPVLDNDGQIARHIAASLGRAFDLNS